VHTTGGHKSGGAPAAGDRGPSPPGDQPDLRTLADVLTLLERRGYAGQFAPTPGGHVRCLTCREEFPAEDATVDTLSRMEGVSDPADMLAVPALTCPRCGAAGALVLNYGPESDVDHADVLARLTLAAGRPEVTNGPRA
jgi:hypothetical protein